MAIENLQQLEITQRKLAQLELALEKMRQREPADVYAVLSQGFVAQIEQMRREIDQYLGIMPAATPESEMVS